MKGAKKIVIGVLILLCVIALAIALFLYKKKEESRALADYIPPSDYVARINTTEALKLAYTLRNDTSAFSSNSRWKDLFNDTTKTGIDFLVDPWVFGDSSTMNVAFQLRSAEKFSKWMQGVADTSFVVDEVNGFHIKEKNRTITFFTNGSNIALLSMGKMAAAIEASIAFYSTKKSSGQGIESDGDLLTIRLNKQLSFGRFLEVSDTLLKLNISKKEITINAHKAIEANKTLSAGVFVNTEKWNALKGEARIKEVFKILGLSKLQVEGEPYLHIYVQDTFHKITKSYSFEFDDNFEKVKVEKVSTKVLPNIGVSFVFKNKQEKEAFMKKNQLSGFKHHFLKLFKGEHWLSFRMKPGEVDKSPREHLVVHSKKIKETLAWNKQFSGVSLRAFKGMETLIYFNDADMGTYLKIETEGHPLPWLLRKMNSKQ